MKRLMTVDEVKEVFTETAYYQLQAVSRTQQDRQREPSVKTLPFPLSAEFWRHCVSSGGNQRHAWSRHQSEEMTK